MYHYITLWSLVINMTWLGIVVFLAVFLFVLHRDARWRWLNFWSFLRYLPLYIIIIYLCGTYFHYLIDQFSLFPLSINQIVRYFSPYEYNFSLIWLVIWILAWGWKFLKEKEKKAAWVSSFLYSVLWWMVPLGIFLLLWDAFVWLPTDWGFFVSAIRSDSIVATYDKVIPLWVYLSLIWILWWSWLFLFHKTLTPNHWYAWFALLFFLVSLVIIFQQYPRRFVSQIGDISIDIKQFFLWAVAIGFLFIWHRSKEI